MQSGHQRSPFARNWIVLLSAFLLPLFFLAACGGSPLSNRESSAGVAVSDSRGSAAAPAASTAPSSAPAAGAAAPNTGSVAQSGPGTTQASPGPLPRRLLVKTGTLGLLVRDVDATFGRISAIAQQYGGEVSQYTNSKNGDVRVATVTILVDSAQFEAAMTALREIDLIIERRSDKAESSDVSEEFADVQAQITNLQATERQLREILAKATSTQDILNVQREITTVRGQIERLQGRANYLDRRAAMSTIVLNLEMPPVGGTGTPTAASGWRFTAIVGDAWQASLRVLQTVATVVISVVVFCWWLLPLLAIGGVLLRQRRQRSRRGANGAPPATATGD